MNRIFSYPIGVLAMAAGGGVGADDVRPNIVFIMSDDHAVRAVSAYGDSLVETPNIDRIAANGVRFDRAYVGNAICGPSRATALTGMHSHGNGFYSNEWSGPFDGTQQTLPRLLLGVGYQTAVIGKWHLYSDPVGFDHWEVIHNQFEQGTYYNPAFRSAQGIEETTGYVADLVTDKAIAWLDKAAADGQPFFLMYNHKTPHRDWLPGPQELAQWNEKARVAEPVTLERDMQALNQARREVRMSITDYMTDNDVKLSMSRNLTPAQAALWEEAFAAGNREFENADMSDGDELGWKYQRYIKTYLASIQSMDRQIGRLASPLMPWSRILIFRPRYWLLRRQSPRPLCTVSACYHCLIRSLLSGRGTSIITFTRIPASTVWHATTECAATATN